MIYIIYIDLYFFVTRVRNISIDVLGKLIVVLSTSFINL